MISLSWLGYALLAVWMWHLNYQMRLLVKAHNHLVDAYIARTPPPDYIRNAYLYEAMKQRGRWKP